MSATSYFITICELTLLHMNILCTLNTSVVTPKCVPKFSCSLRLDKSLHLVPNFSQVKKEKFIYIDVKHFRHLPTPQIQWKSMSCLASKTCKFHYKQSHINIRNFFSQKSCLTNLTACCDGMAPPALGFVWCKGLHTTFIAQRQFWDSSVHHFN